MFKILPLFIFLLLPSGLFAQDKLQIDALILKAKQENLSENKEWQLLNHFWRNIFGVKLSRIDETEFFLSNQSTDLSEEFNVFLKRVVEEEVEDKSSIQCKFPARFNWINKKLKLVENNIVKKRECKEFVAWRDSLDVSRVVLVFPAAYLNNPASMFGHTLLRLDSKVSKKNPLLSYAASFGAATGEDGGIAFAVKGLLGGYRATYNVEPYYDTVQRYGDIEHRDIWEYELNLNDEEKEKLVLSLWELGHTYFDYYFFDENCSFYLLALLDLVRPDLDLLNEFGYWVIPSDTLKVILSRKGLLGEVSYRPSLTQKLEGEAESLDSDELEMAKEVGKGSLLPSVVSSASELDNNKKAQIFEFAFDYIEYQNSKKNTEIDSDRGHAQSILLERSKIKESLSDLKLDNLNTRPDFSHNSGRILTSIGRRGNLSYYDVEAKPAYHDLLDPLRGFKDGAAIDFFNFKLRHYEGDNIQLQGFTPVSVESYSPWTRVFKPFSWSVKASVDRESIPRDGFNDPQGSLVGNLGFNYGLTLKIIEGVRFSLLPGVKSSLSPSYQDSIGALGSGGVAKLFLQLFDSLRLNAAGEFVRYGIGEDHTFAQGRLDLNYDLSDEIVFRTGISRQSNFSQSFSEFYLGLGCYF